MKKYLLLVGIIIVSGILAYMLRNLIAIAVLIVALAWLLFEYITPKK